MQNRTVMLGLGYAGLLPFYGFLAGAWLLSDWPGAVSVQGFVIYSLGILCFLGGTLWGRVQTGEEPLIARLLISNGVVLFAVAAVLTAMFRQIRRTNGPKSRPPVLAAFPQDSRSTLVGLHIHRMARSSQ